MSWTYVRQYEELYVWLDTEDCVEIDAMPLFVAAKPFLGVYVVGKTAYGVYYDPELTEVGVREAMDDFCLYVNHHETGGIPF